MTWKEGNMSNNDDDTLIDGEGNVHEKGLFGQYSPKQGFFGNEQDTNLFGQPNVEHDWLGRPVEERDWLGRPISSSNGEALYRRNKTSSQDSNGGGDIGSGLAAAGVYLAIMGIIEAVKIFREPSSSIYPNNKSPVIAGLLSFFLVGGSGHIYLGQKKKGVIFIILTLFLLGPFGMTIGAIDAYGIASKLKNGQTVEEWEFGLGSEAKGAYIILGIISLIAIVTVVGDYVISLLR